MKVNIDIERVKEKTSSRKHPSALESLEHKTNGNVRSPSVLTESSILIRLGKH